MFSNSTGTEKLNETRKESLAVGCNRRGELDVMILTLVHPVDEKRIQDCQETRKDKRNVSGTNENT